MLSNYVTSQICLSTHSYNKYIGNIVNLLSISKIYWAQGAKWPVLSNWLSSNEISPNPLNGLTASIHKTILFFSIYLVIKCSSTFISSEDFNKTVPSIVAVVSTVEREIMREIVSRAVSRTAITALVKQTTSDGITK